MTAATPERVLIIDDDQMVGQILVSHVKACGHEVRVTDDPDKFFTYEREWRPTFVFVDLVMERMDGLEVLSRLSEAGTTAAVVISSGMGSRVLDAAQQIAAESGLAYGGVLTKPFRRDDVRKVLENPPHAPAPREVAPTDGIAAWSDLEFEDSFRDAITRDRISVAYQPKIACGGGEVVGYEALARWWHADLGWIPPAAFVLRAEQTGLTRLLTETVVGSALRWFAGTHARGTERISINISAADLSHSDLDARLVQACRTAGMSPRRVVLELTETSAMENQSGALQLLTRLRLKGFLLSIDDFGTGYSSMAQLSRLPFSEVKIDRSFVSTVTESGDAEIMVRSMLDLGRALGLECAAEGVESAEVLGILARLGCDYAQGFHIARPMFPDQLIKWQPGASQ